MYPYRSTDGAVADDDADEIRGDLEADPPAVATTGEHAHAGMLDDRFPARQRGARRNTWGTGARRESSSSVRALPDSAPSVASPGPACASSGSTAATTTASCRCSTRWRR